MRLLAASLLAFTLIAAAPAFAEEEPPARVGRVSLVAGQLGFQAKGDDAAYCTQLSALYRRYLDNAGEGRNVPEVTASVAMDDCAKGNTAAGIPVLERKLRDGRFSPPPRG